MMIKANGEFLEFNDPIDIERQVKPFENISETDGDFSYDFELQDTNENRRKLGFPLADNALKLVYQKINCELINDDGQKVYDGFLRIERVSGMTMNCSFFSGNSNWFGLLSGPMSDIDFSDLDVDQTVSNILVYRAATSGIVFPIVDNGLLIRRGYRQIKVEDFVAGVYVKTVFKRIFQHHSIKIQGELLDDPLYNSMITQSNNKSQDEIDANSSYVQKSATTARPGENVRYKLTFQNDSVYPYYDGSNNAFDLANSRYVATAKTRIHLEASFVPQIVDASYNERIYIYINGAFPGFVDIGLPAGGLYNSATPGDQDNFTLDRTIDLEAGDVLELYGEWQQSTGSTQNDVLRGWMKVTPTYIYKVFGNAAVPRKWTQQQYVSNILRLFNVITHFDNITQTLTFNFFDKIKSKEPIDISEFISDLEVDYTDFISNYGKRNLFGYNEVDFDDLRDYNVQNFFKYAQGSIDVDNDFLSDSETIVESDFSNPIGYINPAFDMSMERLNLTDAEAQESVEVTSVSQVVTWARFAIPTNIFLDKDLVRISDSTNPTYNGDWMIDNIGVGYIEVYGLPFDTDATATITRLLPTYADTDDVYLMVNIPFYLVTNFSGFNNVRFEDFDQTEFGLAFFNLLQTGRVINTDYKQSLSFGTISNPLQYQMTLLDSYWSLPGRVLNDPVKLFAPAHLPNKTFLDIDFLRPITVKAIETSNMYYANRITGYENSSIEATIELIKLP